MVGTDVQKTVPLVSISVLQPFVSALREHGFDPQVALSVLDFSGEPSEHPETVVHTNRVNRFLDTCVAQTGDAQFCSKVGLSLNPEGWPMIFTALNQARSLAEFISIYIDGSNSVATSVQTYLDVRGEKAAFGQKRLTKPDTLPGQNDGFMAALYFAIIRFKCTDLFDPQQISIMVCDPSALADQLIECNVSRGDWTGHRVQFPTRWLAAAGNAAKIQGEFARKDLLSSLRMQLLQIVGTRPLSAADVALLSGISLSRLKRALSRQGTSISAEVERAKLAYAKDALKTGKLTVREIAINLGYSDPSNFARAFRREVGVSPSAFRSEHDDQSTGS